MRARRTSQSVWSRSPDAGIKFLAKTFCGERRRLKSRALRGEHAIGRKPLRREGRVAPVEPVVILCATATGATSIRSSLRPLHRGGPSRCITSGENAPRERSTMSQLLEIRIDAQHSPRVLPSSPGLTGPSSTPRPLDSSTAVSGILDCPPSRAMTDCGVGKANGSARTRGPMTGSACPSIEEVCCRSMVGTAHPRLCRPYGK
jgi:hypothetical protein